MNGYIEPGSWQPKAIASYLKETMNYCRHNGINFTACLAEARKQFNREVREKADATPLDAT